MVFSEHNPEQIFLPLGDLLPSGIVAIRQVQQDRGECNRGHHFGCGADRLLRKGANHAIFTLDGRIKEGGNQAHRAGLHTGAREVHRDFPCRHAAFLNRRLLREAPRDFLKLPKSGGVLDQLRCDAEDFERAFRHVPRLPHHALYFSEGGQLLLDVLPIHGYEGRVCAPRLQPVLKILVLLRE